MQYHSISRISNHSWLFSSILEGPSCRAPPLYGLPKLPEHWYLRLDPVYPPAHLERFQLGHLEHIHTFKCALWWQSYAPTVTKKKRVGFIEWLSNQVESLPASHPLGLVVFDISENYATHAICAQSPEDWYCLDTILAKRAILVTFNLPHAEEPFHVNDCNCRRIITSAFRFSNKAGLVSFGWSTACYLDVSYTRGGWITSTLIEHLK